LDQDTDEAVERLMPISYERRCILVHVPKTAGTSMEVALGIYGGRSKKRLFGKFEGRYLQHLTAAQIRKCVGRRVYEDFFKVAVIRNPWDRAVSEFLWRRSLPGVKKKHRSMSFEKFLRRMWGSSDPHFIPQKNFLDAEVDLVGRMEEIDKVWDRVCRRLDLSIPLPHEKKNNRKHYSRYYDVTTRGIVGDLFSEDIERFGYRFEAR